MTIDRSNRWVCVGLAVAVLMLVTTAASAQTEDVQSRVVTHQAAAVQMTPDPLAEWNVQYKAALDEAKQMQRASSTRELGKQLELDLTAYDTALREYQRVSERLRHKDRALSATMAKMENAAQANARTFQAMSNIRRAGHDTAKAIINNLR